MSYESLGWAGAERMKGWYEDTMTRATYVPPPSDEPTEEVHAGLVHVLPVVAGARFLPTPGTGAPVTVVGLLLFDTLYDTADTTKHERQTWLEAVDIRGRTWLVTSETLAGEGELEWPDS